MKNYMVAKKRAHVFLNVISGINVIRLAHSQIKRYINYKKKNIKKLYFATYKMSISDQIEREINKKLAIATIEITERVIKKLKESERVIKKTQETQE